MKKKIFIVAIMLVIVLSLISIIISGNKTMLEENAWQTITLEPGVTYHFDGGGSAYDGGSPYLYTKDGVNFYPEKYSEEEQKIYPSIDSIIPPEEDMFVTFDQIEDGYTFDGFYIEGKEKLGVIINPDGTFNTRYNIYTKNKGKDIKLIAKWTENK